MPSSRAGSGNWLGTTTGQVVLGGRVDRGLRYEQAQLVVLDGSKALRKAVDTVVGSEAPVQRCVYLEAQDAAAARAVLAVRGEQLAAPNQLLRNIARAVHIGCDHCRDRSPN